MRITTFPAFVLLAGVAGAQPATPTAPAPPGTTRVDARFEGWLGCWTLEDDVAGTGALVCITPDGPGVRLETTVAGTRTAEQALRGDGVARPIVDAGCKGTERAEWSKDDGRLLRFAEVACGSEASRSVRAILSFGPGPAGLNVEMVDGGGPPMVRVQRYRRVIDEEPADDEDVAEADVSAPPDWLTRTQAPWDVDDVIEASRRMPAEVVQAALTEVRGPFALDRKSLIALADAGVPEPTIDLMIGLTYRKRFRIQRGGDPSTVEAGAAVASRSYNPFFYWGSGYGGCYSSYGYLSYYDDPGCVGEDYDYWYSRGDPWVPVEPGPPVPTEPPSHGRVVNGRGYTQVTPRESEPTGRWATGSSGGGSGGSSGSSGSSGGSSSDGSSVSSSGYSSGGSHASSSNDSGERTAVPRPPER